MKKYIDTKRVYLKLSGGENQNAFTESLSNAFVSVVSLYKTLLEKPIFIRETDGVYTFDLTHFRNYIIREVATDNQEWLQDTTLLSFRKEYNSHGANMTGDVNDTNKQKMVEVVNKALNILSRVVESNLDFVTRDTGLEVSVVYRGVPEIKLTLDTTSTTVTSITESESRNNIPFKTNLSKDLKGVDKIVDTLVCKKAYDVLNHTFTYVERYLKPQKPV